ncbi:response regulator transcription factor [Coraliomargarita parva]|uniref:response regulator transcription factor n=1 Tax=Coraliomargarita parva TaxID=3014050 RepID=UPI0022B50469|nr:response regulator transcription factor [Coraliomargarita parva]
MRILVVEDSENLRNDLAKAMRHSGHAVDLAEDGETGLWMAREAVHDVIVLDIMLPGMDGLTVLSTIRQEGIATPVLLLTARNTVDDRVSGLRSGADDYLGKPFALEEFLARTEALGRRARGRSETVLTAGDLVLDTNAKTASRNACDLELTAREYALLELLMMAAGKVFSRAGIEEHLYDESGMRMSNVVDSTVYHLRRKLGTDGSRIIVTRRGEGYQFCEPTIS